MLKATRSSVASAFRVDDDEGIGGGGSAGAESGGSVVERKMGSIVHTPNNWRTRELPISSELGNKV